MFEDKQQLAALRKKALEYAENIGVIGGMCVIHPYRGRKPFMDKIRSGEIQPDKSYHFHIIGLRIPDEWEKSNDFYSRTGWIYKWVDEIKKNGLPRNMYAKIRYELDHAGLPELNKKFGQIATWTGICSRHGVSQIAIKTHEPRICMVCQVQAHRYDLDESCDRGPAELVHTRYEHPITREAIERARIRFKLITGPARYEDLKGVLLHG